jgi:hypothetical protein
MGLGSRGQKASDPGSTTLLSLLTNSALVHEPKCGVCGGEGGCGVSANEYSCVHGAQINCGDLTPYLIYDSYGLWITNLRFVMKMNVICVF